MSNRIQFRRDTSERWASINPILLEGELGMETDTRFTKIGDGVKRWNDLKYAIFGNNISNEIGDNDDLVPSLSLFTEKLNAKVGLQPFDGIVDLASISMQSSVTEGGSVVFVKSANIFAYRFGATYYSNWNINQENRKKSKYIDNDTLSVLSDRLYLYNGVVYYFNGSDLIPVVEVVNTKGDDDRNKVPSQMLFSKYAKIIEGHQTINANSLMNQKNSIKFSDFTTWLDSADIDKNLLLTYGTEVHYLSRYGWNKMLYVGNGVDKDYQSAASWQVFDDSSIINISRIIEDFTPITLEKAIDKLNSLGYGVDLIFTKQGVIITFNGMYGFETWQRKQDGNMTQTSHWEPFMNSQSKVIDGGNAFNLNLSIS